MKLSQLLVTLLVSAITAFVIFTTLQPKHGDPLPVIQKETAYQHVVASGILRCGYQYWDGAVMRDNTSGQIHGPWVDIMNAIGAATGLKVEWTAQVGWDEVGAALKAGKIDAMCAGMWTSAIKAKEIAYSTPLAYQALEAFGRADDHRFDAGLETINSDNVTIAVIDNDNSDFIAQQDYPKAKRVALGQMNGTDSDLMMYVSQNKADVTFTVTGLFRQFDKSNPGKLRRLFPDHKLRVFGLANAVNNDEPQLLILLNAASEEIQNSGRLDQILDLANTDYPDMFIKPLKHFP